MNKVKGLGRAERLMLLEALGEDIGTYGAGDAQQGVVLIGRPFGKAARPKLEAALEALPPQNILPIDCSGVRMVDASFGDEVFVRLARLRASGQFPGRYFVLMDVGEEMQENLDLVCRMKGVVIPFQDGLLGEVGAELKATYDLAVEQGYLTSRLLIEQVGEDRLALTAASNRLSRLEEMGILAPIDGRGVDGGARQKVYAPVQ